MRLADELSVAQALFDFDAPKELRREQLRNMIDKLFPRIKADIKAKMIADIAKWPENIEPQITKPPTTVGKSAASPSRQGQVTKNTPAKK
jgi:hypothetical protein